MAVLTRSALEASPLADLHALASELGIDGYRRLRKADLVGTILEHQGGEDDAPPAEAAVETAPEAAEDEKPKRRRGSRGGRARKRDADEGEDGVTDEGAGDDDEEEAPAPRARRSRSRKAAAEPAEAEAEAAEEEPAEEPRPRRSRGSRDAEDRVVTGTVELLPNGSGFLRTAPPEPSDDDVYISAAQVRRCELVNGDEVAGPVREPRRSERYPSLIRIDTINGKPADEVAEGTHFDDLPCALPSERLALGSEDPTLKAIEWLTPIGKGSRATIVGPEHSGKTEALRRLAGALSAIDGLEVHVVLAGVRPEECADWKASSPEPVATLTAAASGDAQTQAVERAIDTAKRVTARGGDVVVLIDSLDHVAPGAARRALSAARNIVDGGSLTIIAAAAAPVGGETTIIALDRDLTRTGRFPAVDLAASGALRPELLVGDAGAEAIAKARAKAING